MHTAINFLMSLSGHPVARLYPQTTVFNLYLRSLTSDCWL